MFHLVCINAALGHIRGDIITDTEKVAAYLASDVEHHFVKIAAPEPASPAEPPAS
jgi:hypothetical protein